MAEGRRPITEFSPMQVYQLILDIFATRRGEEWDKKPIPWEHDEEVLIHPDGRRVALSFERGTISPQAAVAFRSKEPGQYPPDDCIAEYEFEIGKDGWIDVYYDFGWRDLDPTRQIILDNLSSEAMYRDILRAHINTPFRRK